MGSCGVTGSLNPSEFCKYYHALTVLSESRLCLRVVPLITVSSYCIMLIRLHLETITLAHKPYLFKRVLLVAWRPPNARHLQQTLQHGCGNDREHIMDTALNRVLGGFGGEGGVPR